MEGAVITEEAVIETRSVIKSGIICDAYVKSGAIVDAGTNCVRGIISKQWGETSHDIFKG